MRGTRGQVLRRPAAGELVAKDGDRERLLSEGGRLKAYPKASLVRLKLRVLNTAQGRSFGRFRGRAASLCPGEGHRPRPGHPGGTRLHNDHWITIMQVLHYVLGLARDVDNPPISTGGPAVDPAPAGGPSPCVPSPAAPVLLRSRPVLGSRPAPPRLIAALQQLGPARGGGISRGRRRPVEKAREGGRDCALRTLPGVRVAQTRTEPLLRLEFVRGR